MSGKKSDKPRRKYDEEFKKNVLKMASGDRRVSEVAESLGISPGLVHKWRVDQTKSAGASQPVSDSVPGADYERVKARLREVEQERDILKKALGIFSRGN